MAGTGNLLLKRGTTIPADAALPRGMPAAQLISPSPTLATDGTLAYLNYPNRLWMGMDGTQAANQEGATGSVNFTGAEPGAGGQNSANFYSETNIGLAPNLNTVFLENDRPIWIGAEIRAYAAVDQTDPASGPYTILKADWNNPSDYVLVTQKAISYMPLRVIDSVSPGSNARNYIEFAGWDTATNGDIDASYKIQFPASTTAPSAGEVLKVKGSPSGSGTTSDPYIIGLEWGVGGTAGGMTSFTFKGDTGTATVTDSEDVVVAGGIGLVSAATVSGSINTVTVDLDFNSLSTITLDNADSFAFYDNSGTTHGKVTADGLRDYVLGGVSGDITINSSGVATIAANSVELGTDTAGNYVADVTAGPGLTKTSSAGEGQTVDLAVGAGTGIAVNADNVALSFNTLSAVTPEDADSFAFYDASGTTHARVTGANLKTYVLGGSTINASTVALTQTETATGAHYITFVDAFTGNEDVRTDTGLSYVPSTNTITTSAMNLVGSLGLTTEKIGNNNTLEINAAGGSGTVIRGSQNFAGDSTRPTLSVDPSQLVGSNTQFVRINGGDLYLGNKSIDGVTNTPVNIIFEGATNSGTTNRTTLTVVDPTAARTVTIPNESGTFILVDSNLDCISKIRNLTISGDLEINGTTTTVNTTNLDVEDSIVTLQYNYTGGSPSDSGIQIERGSAGADVQLLWDESETKWSANRNGTNLYPLTISDSNSGLHAAGTEGSGDTTNGKSGVQYVHSAAIKYLDVKNLVMSGSWTLNATINSNLDLKDGGLKLPYLSGVYHSANAMSSLPEGQIAYDSGSNKAIINIGSTGGNDTTGTTQASIITTSNLTDITQTGTLSSLTVSGALNANGGIAVDTNAFTVADTSGNTSIAGTLGVAGVTTLSSTLTVSGSTINFNGANPTFATSQASGTLAVFNAGFLGTTNAFGASQIINIGISQTTSGAITLGSANTTTTNAGALTVTGTLTANGALTANGNIILGSDANDTLTVNATILGSLIFEGSAADNFETTLTPGNPSADITISMPAWGGTMVVPSGASTTNYIITSTGTSAQPAWTDPDTIVVGGVRVNFQTSVGSATRYPIPFLGNNRSTDATDPTVAWSATTEGTYQNSYLYANYTGGGTNTGPVNNYTSGLFYELNDNTGSGVGTLFCDYIGATLDCGSYT